LEKFVTGILEENEDGATYQSIVYDRFLKVRCANNELITIFDIPEPISTYLNAGKVYTFVLSAFVSGLRYIEQTPVDSKEETGFMGGLIINPEWSATNSIFQYTRPELYDCTWILVATRLGHVLIDAAELQIIPIINSYLVWSSQRWDLYAVV
jgi:hypothetical protein